jgi:hypothetical protein
MAVAVEEPGMPVSGGLLAGPAGQLGVDGSHLRQDRYLRG